MPLFKLVFCLMRILPNYCHLNFHGGRAEEEAVSGSSCRYTENAPWTSTGAKGSSQGIKPQSLYLSPQTYSAYAFPVYFVKALLVLGKQR